MDDLISYREDFGMWWPLYDHAPEKCHARLMGRHKDLDEVVTRCENKRVCVQAGGHVGVWPRRLASSFERVFTFEPDPHLFACLEQNLPANGKIKMFKSALGATSGTAKMAPHVSAGSWKVTDHGTIYVQMTSIDDLELKDVDAILLDVESYEFEVVKGARKTIEKYKPVILLEEGKRKHETRAFMESLGYMKALKIHDDCIFVPCKR